MGLAALRQALKDDYVRVEYIENTSNAYILPNYKTNANTIIEIDVQITTINVQARIIGNASGYFESYINGNKRFSFASNGSTYSSNVNANTQRHIFKLDNTISKGYIDNTEVKIAKNTSKYYNTIYLIARGEASNLKCKIYGCKIYDGDTLVRDFIPMYQKSKDLYGLWDRVNEEFYTSPNGVKFTGGERYDTTDIIEVHPKLIANTFINENTGAQQNYGGWSSSDYIDVEGFKYIQVPYPFSKMNYKYGAYYDKDKKRISNTASLTIPSNAKYVRLSSTTGGFTNVWLFKRQFTTSKAYQTNYYIETDGSIRAYNGWNIFNTESVYNYFYCWIYEQSNRYQASYNADGSVYQSGKGFLEKPKDGKVLLSDNHTSITYYAGYNYEYKNMNE